MLIKESKTIVKNSHFQGHLYSISTIEEYEQILSKITKEHKKANHICIGCIMKDFEKFKNDKEIGSPGKILLSLLKDKKLKSHLLIVVRYFGGIKLGSGGVQRAFKECGKKCLE